MIPIHKKGKDKNVLESYRPINNLNIIEKIVETIIKTQINDFIERNKHVH